MIALQVAVDSNNTGVALLGMARYEEALEVFRSAADLMYVVTQQMKVGQVDAPCCTSTTKVITDTQDKIQSLASSLRVANKQGVLLTPDETDCFLHDQGFNLAMPSQHEEVPCALHSATILANMAMTYHLSVPQTSSSDSLTLRNALTLYEMAYSVASRVEQNEDSSRVIMAALNNMAHIHHERGLYEQSRHILDNLQDYIWQRIKSENCIFSPEKRVYILNALFLNKPQGAAAA